MTDKELYNYFKERQHVFNEAPGDEVWNKIESGLTKKMPVKALFITVIISAVAGAFFLIFFTLNNNQAPVTKEHRAPLQEPAQSIITEETAPGLIKQSSDTVKKKKAPKKQTEDKKVVYNILASTPDVAENKKPDEKLEHAIKDSLPGNNKITILPGKIRIESMEQLTKQEYDTLITRSLRHYSNQPKSILIIIAKGYKPYRERVEAGLQAQKAPPLKGYVKFMRIPDDTLKEDKPNLAPIYDSQLKTNEDTMKKIKPAQDTITTQFSY